MLAPLGAVTLRAGGFSALGAGDGAALWFTLWQAVVSALVSCVLAIPVARALYRRRFPGRGLLISLMGAPFILPTIVAVMGLIRITSYNVCYTKLLREIRRDIFDEALGGEAQNDRHRNVSGADQLDRLIRP